MNEFRIPLGIRKPETAKETEDQLGSIDGMRRAILRASRDSGIIRTCLDQAQYRGLSGEDTYVLLAYHALRMLEDMHRNHSDLLARMPLPPVIMKDNGQKIIE